MPEIHLVAIFPEWGQLKRGQLTFPSLMQLNVLTSCDKISLYAILRQ